jgi:hypothetical protein
MSDSESQQKGLPLPVPSIGPTNNVVLWQRWLVKAATSVRMRALS